MRLAVESWSPDYGAEFDAPEARTAEEVDPSCEERPWDPVVPAGGDGAAALPVAFVDGVRRLDARLHVMDGEGAPVPGVAGSIGAGAVLCEGAAARGGDGRRGPQWWSSRRAEVYETRIDRYLAVGGGMRVGLTAGPGLEYRPLPHTSSELEQIVDSVHDAMRGLEAELAQKLASEGRLVFVDGPLAVMRPGPRRIVGFIKAHHRRYLDAEREHVLVRLGCGERTPLFAFGEPRPRYSWYLRLCDVPGNQHGWYGLVRCEAPAALGRDEVVSLADASASLLPGFASRPHWDARAPQNLVPVAGLEKRLRHLLGDPVMVTRLLRSAAARVGEGE